MSYYGSPMEGEIVKIVRYWKRIGYARSGIALVIGFLLGWWLG